MFWESCLVFHLLLPLWLIGEHELSRIGRYPSTRIRHQSLVAMLLDSACSQLREGKAYPKVLKHLLLVSIGRFSIRSQLLTICYSCSILAFLWRKVTGDCSVPAENLLVIGVTACCWNSYCLHCSASWKLAFGYESIMKSDAHRPCTWAYTYTPPEKPKTEH